LLSHISITSFISIERLTQKSIQNVLLCFAGLFRPQVELIQPQKAVAVTFKLYLAADVIINETRLETRC
jgi:hypothetical protein